MSSPGLLNMETMESPVSEKLFDWNMELEEPLDPMIPYLIPMIGTMARLVLEKKYNQQLMATKHIAVSTWLEAIGLIDYLPLFTQYVGVEDLLYLTESEIRNLGVHNGGHRAKIVSSLRILKEKYEKGRNYKSPDNSLNKSNQISSPYVQVSPPSPLSHPDYSTVNVSPEKLQADLQRELHSDSSELKSHGWYHGNITRQHAEAIVKADGDFLVRDCISKPGDFVLTCCWHGVPLHFMINASVQEAERGALPKILYQFEDDSFQGIQDLIHHYLSKCKFVTQTSKAILKHPISRSMPLSYYDSKYGALSSLSSAGAYTPTQSPRPSPFASPSESPSNSPKMDRRRPYRTGSQPMLSVEELRDAPKIQIQSMDRSDSLPAINVPVSKHSRSPSRDRPVYNYHQRSGSEPVLMSETLRVPNTLAGNKIGSDSDLFKPAPPKPSRIPSVKYKQRPKVQVRNVALYEDDGRDYSDYSQVKEDPSWLKGSNSQPVSPDVTTPVCKSSPFDIYDNNFNNIKLNPPLSHELYGKALSNRNFPDLKSPQKEFSSPDIYNINNKYDNNFMKRRKITIPVIKNGMSYNPTGNTFNVLPNDCKPLEAGSMIMIKAILLEKDPRTLALHCTKTDLDCVHVLSHEDFGMGVESGLELLTLPQGQQLRQDMIERCHCMKLLVIVTILTCSTISERAQMISQWIMVAQELKLLGNLFGFVNVMDGIMSPLVTRLKTTRLILRQNHTNSAYILDTKLKTAYKSLNEGTSSLPLQNVCVPNINPLVYLLERDLETVLNELPWERINPVAGLEMFLTHLDTARVIAAQVELYQITGTAVMADFQGDTDIMEVFDTRLHLNLLWGTRGSSVNRVDRHRKFDQLLTVLSERAEKSNDDGTAV